MPLNIKDPHTDRLARALAAATGETLTEAVQVALQERFDKISAADRAVGLVAVMDELSARVHELPDIGMPSADEAVSYDEHGLPA